MRTFFTVFKAARRAAHAAASAPRPPLTLALRYGPGQRRSAGAKKNCLRAAIPSRSFRAAADLTREPSRRLPSGRPITSRRYDHRWTRLDRQLAWVRTQQTSSHWIRHIRTLTWVERNFGYAVARAYAGHTDGGSEGGATATYVRASLAEVAAALAALTGEPHPLATTEGW